MFDNLTAQQQQQQQNQQPDIYAILSSDDHIGSSTPIDTDALVMDMFNTNTSQQRCFDEHPLSNLSNSNNSIESNISTNNTSSFPTPNSVLSSTNTKELGLGQDFLNFDITASNNQPQQDLSQQQQQSQPLYTPSSDVGLDSLFSLSYPEQDPVFPTFNPPARTSNVDFTRRHSVAVSGGIADFNLRNLSQHYQQPGPSPFGTNNAVYSTQLKRQQQLQQQQHVQTPQQESSQQAQSSQFSAPRQMQYPKHPPLFSRKTHQQLATVMEGETPPNMSHRASMPNIFLSEESRRRLANSIQQRVGSISANTTPTNTPPPITLNFNQMPWSTEGSNSNNNSAATTPNKIATTPSSNENSPSQEFTTNGDANLLMPSLEDRPFVGRKRFYSQQFDSLPTTSSESALNMPFNATPQFQSFQQQQQVSSNLCPLPMSGILSRRTSIATPNDISTWNRMVNPNDRIKLDQQQMRKRQKQSLEQQNAFNANLTQQINQQQTQQQPQQQQPQQNQQQLLQQQQQSVDTDKSESASLNGSVATAEEGTLEDEEDYPAITESDLEAAKKDPNAIPRRQKSRYEGDEYTPKWVRYTGQMKEGYCDTCKPGKWLQLKNSAFWYHKQFFHGISSVSGKPFQRPLEQRAGEHDVIEGLCHQCKQFVPICNSKRKNSVLWYRHAHKCHIYDKPKAKGNKRASISVSTKKYQAQKIY